ncbi:MAG TPA: 2Fe-2S iron-sulfur cluster-binding protein [Clostridia bacterium]|nr:2Fe-2S iron-sulfur cluster-binding protein [Clostridia bacterium]
MSYGTREMTTVTVFRYDPALDQEPRYEKYEVPFEPNESIVGVLDYIRAHYDSTFSFRYSCRTGCCMICTYRLNGKTVVTCRTKMQKDMVIEPVNKDRVMKDLMVNMDR